MTRKELELYEDCTEELKKTFCEWRIKERQKMLENTDYVCNKLTEALAEAIIHGNNEKLVEIYNEYSEILTERQKLRDEINIFETKDEKTIIESTGKQFVESYLFDGEPTEEQYISIRYIETETEIVKEYSLVNKEIIKAERPEERFGYKIVENRTVNDKTIEIEYSYEPKRIIHTDAIPEEKDGYVAVLKYREDEDTLAEYYEYEKVVDYEENTNSQE